MPICRVFCTAEMASVEAIPSITAMITNTWIMYDDVLWLWRAVSSSEFLACHSVTERSGTPSPVGRHLRRREHVGDLVSTVLTWSVERPSRRCRVKPANTDCWFAARDPRSNTPRWCVHRRVGEYD
jgi:hypothetical protein